MTKHLYLIPTVVMLLAAPSCASEPGSARIQSLGGAGVALPTEAATIYWNPAGLLFQNRMAVDLTFQFDGWDAPGNWGFSYLNYSRTARQGAGLGIYRMLLPADGSPAEGGDAVAAVLSTVYRTPIGVPLGVSFKYINENWAEAGRKNLFTGDAGMFIPAGPWLVGVSVHSFTQPDSRVFPYRVLAGLSWSYESHIVLTAQVGVRTWDEVEDLDLADRRAGMEVSLTRAVAVQAGYAISPQWEYWTGGVSISAGRQGARLSLGYHWHPEGDRDDRVFLGYSYGL